MDWTEKGLVPKELFDEHGGVMNAATRWIDPNKTLSQSERYAKKLEILRNVIYGVDIQPMAAQFTVDINYGGVPPNVSGSPLALSPSKISVLV